MDQMTNRPDRPLNEDDVRRIVREEIARAMEMLGRAAERADSYDSDTIQTYAYGCITEAAQGAARRVSCPHETYESWGGLYAPAPRTCRQCGEPEPEPENPFEDKEDRHAQG